MLGSGTIRGLNHLTEGTVNDQRACLRVRPLPCVNANAGAPGAQSHFTWQIDEVAVRALMNAACLDKALCLESARQRAATSANCKPPCAQVRHLLHSIACVLRILPGASESKHRSCFERQMQGSSLTLWSCEAEHAARFRTGIATRAHSAVAPSKQTWHMLRCSSHV